jgi:hypothetical protein
MAERRWLEIMASHSPKDIPRTRISRRNCTREARQWISVYYLTQGIQEAKRDSSRATRVLLALCRTYKLIAPYFPIPIQILRANIHVVAIMPMLTGRQPNVIVIASLSKNVKRLSANQILMPLSHLHLETERRICRFPATRGLQNSDTQSLPMRQFSAII